MPEDLRHVARIGLARRIASKNIGRRERRREKERERREDSRLGFNLAIGTRDATPSVDPGAILFLDRRPVVPGNDDTATTFIAISAR